MVHRWCEEAILCKLGRGPRPEDVEGEEANNAVSAFRDWVRLNDVEWHTVEQKLYHRGHKYAGTVDATATVNDEYCVIDFKTSKAVYAPYHLQCAAYAKAIEDMTGNSTRKGIRPSVRQDYRRVRGRGIYRDNGQLHRIPWLS